MKAVLMAGGEGSRLRPLTIIRPKPMVPIVNKPVMEHVLALLKRHGITEVIVTVQYLASVIEDYFGDGSSLGMHLSYSVEEVPLGTAGSVKAVQDQLDDTFLVISADALTDFDLGGIVEFHRSHHATATLTLYQVPNPLEYGVVIIDDEGRIRQFLEKPSWGEVFSDTVNTGIYVLEPTIFDYYEAGKSVDFSQNVFPELLRQKDQLFGFVASGYWCDVGNIQEYMRANADVLLGKVDVGPLGHEIGSGIWCETNEVEIAPDAQIYGPTWLGEACKIKSGVIIRGPSIIRDFTIVDSRAQIDRSIIWRNSYIGERAEVRGAIIGRQCSLKSKSMVFEGAVVGDQTIVGEGAIIQPGVKIWPAKEIETGATVSSSVIWGSHGRRNLFGRWGVTGLVNIDLTPEFAARLAAAYGSILPKGSNVVLNRDLHRSPRMIKRAITSGLPSTGINVIDIKSQPIPVARFITRNSSAVGGVHVRLSPLDNRVVDIKIFDAQGLDIDRKTERKIESSFFREDVRRVYFDEVGTISEQPDLADEYGRAFVQAVNVDALRRIRECPLVLDYAHSPSSEVLVPLWTQMGIDIVGLNSSMLDERPIWRPDELDLAMSQLAAITRSLRARLGVRLDPGGEHIFAVDNRGDQIPGWKLLGAVASLVLREQRGGTIAVPVTAPNLFEWVAQRSGGSVVRTRADVVALMEAATRPDVVLAGDDQGGLIFPRFQPAMDALYAVVKILELLATQEASLSDELDALPSYYTDQTKVPCPWDSKGKVMRLLSQQYQSTSLQNVDGIRIDLGKSEWVLVLPDVDHPLFHVIAESGSGDGARVLMEKYAALVSSLQR
ncbi:MAG TPA: mannose-1-phosphate guanyltransferase [Chloroflexota bacterium]|nr:mannose-1-phosphate guanyltransferase [Chloroflexota bacterium]